MRKKCSTCKGTKGPAEFHKSKATSDGYQTSCKECQKIAHETSAAKRINLKSRLKTKYNLSLEEYEEQVNWQSSCCLICCEHVERLCVDHDHTTGQTRGFICDLCNKGLGMFKDNPETVERAFNYLKAYKHG